jgi:O-antigen ligase
MTIEIKKSRTNFLFQPKSIAWTIGIIIIVWTIMQWALAGVVLLAVLVLFVIGFKRPILALAAILASQLTITSYMIDTPIISISLRLILMLATLLIIKDAISRKEIDLGPNASMLIVPTVLLTVFVILSNMVNSIEFDQIFRDFRNYMVSVLFIFLIPAIITDLKHLKIICSIVFIIITASAIIGVLQRFNILGMGQATLIPDVFYEMGRVPGIGETELEIAYLLPATIVVLLAIIIYRSLSRGKNALLAIPLVPMFLSLYFTYTRSAIFAVGYAVLSLFLFMKAKSKWWITLVITFIILVLLANSDILSGATISGRSESVQEESSVARAILWQAGLAIAIENPMLGIGGGQFTTVSPQYTNKVDKSLIEWEGNRYWSYTTLGNDEPHNDFIMMWLSYGTPAFLMFLWIHFVILRNLMLSFLKTHNRFLKGLSLGLACALISYVVNSFYHNLLVTLPLLWIIAGFSLVTLKIASKEKEDLKPIIITDKL